MSKRGLLAFLIAIVMVVTSLSGLAYADPPEGGGDQEESGNNDQGQDNDPPPISDTDETITISNYNVDKTKVSLNDEITICFHVKADVPINIDDCVLEYRSDMGDSAGAWLDRDKLPDDLEATEADLSFTAHLRSYGEWGMSRLSVELSDGGTAVFLDRRFLDDEEPLQDDEYAVDFSVCNVSVTADGEEDTVKPVIDPSSFTVSDYIIECEEETRVGIKIQDDSDIRRIDMEFCTTDWMSDEEIEQQNASKVITTDDGEIVPNENDGLYWIPLTAYYGGHYQAVSISVYDVFYNRTTIYNSDWGEEFLEGYCDGTDDPVSMTGANFIVNAEVNEEVDDHQAPVINPNSIEIDHQKVAYRKETNAVHVDIEDDGEIKDLYVVMLTRCRVPRVTSLSAYDWANHCFVTDDEGRYVFTAEEYQHKYIGDWVLQAIVATDTGGNTSIIADPNACRKLENLEDYYDEDETEFRDLSEHVYLCGLKDADKSTETFAYGDAITNPDNAELNATEIEDGTDKHEELMTAFETAHYDSDGFDNPGLYEVELDMEGGIPEDDYVKVLLPAGKEQGYQEGDIVRISHLTGDGSIQTRYSKVKNGSALIGVNEFSPFIIEKADENTAQGIAKDMIDPEPMTFIPSDNKNADRQWDGDTSICFIEGDAIRVYDEIKEQYVTYQYGNGDDGNGFYYNNKKLGGEIRPFVDDDSDGLTAGERFPAKVLCNGFSIATQEDFTFKLYVTEENWNRFNSHCEDGVRYRVEDMSDQEAIVAGFWDDFSETTAIIIKDKVSINGKEYPVTAVAEDAFTAFNTVLKEATVSSGIKQFGYRALGYVVSEVDGNLEFNKIENFTIKGYKGTAAEAYAKENGFKFVDLEEEAQQAADKAAAEQAAKQKAAYLAQYNAAVKAAQDAKTKLTYAKAKKKRKALVKWNRVSGASGYQIRYSTNKKFKKGVKTIVVNDGNAARATLKKLKARKRYYIQVRPFKSIKNLADGKTTSVVGKWSNKKSIKARK